MFNKIIRILGGDPNRKKIQEHAEVAEYLVSINFLLHELAWLAGAASGPQVAL